MIWVVPLYFPVIFAYEIVLVFGPVVLNRVPFGRGVSRVIPYEDGSTNPMVMTFSSHVGTAVGGGVDRETCGVVRCAAVGDGVGGNGSRRGRGYRKTGVEGLAGYYWFYDKGDDKDNDQGTRRVHDRFFIHGRSV